MPTASRSTAIESLSQSERLLLASLQKQALRYFLENQLPHGLVLDRQRNFGSRRFSGLISSSATGMGFIAVALSSSKEYGLLSHREACLRLRTGLDTITSLPQVQGMFPHFVRSRDLSIVGADAISTIDSSWLLAGALWAAEFLGEPELVRQAQSLFNKVNWTYWANGHATGMLSHGYSQDNKFLDSRWDRFNAETAFMYVLARGNQSRVPAEVWTSLKPHLGKLAQIEFASADLGLFTSQYSLELCGDSLSCMHDVQLPAEAVKAAYGNYRLCRELAARFKTFSTFWGISAGDGPPERGRNDAYRAYCPTEFDGTAHVTATLASLAAAPTFVMENVTAAERCLISLRGRYGYSNVNLDKGWRSKDVVGIDLGAVVMALDNAFYAQRVHRVWMRLNAVQEALSSI